MRLTAKRADKSKNKGVEDFFNAFVHSEIKIILLNLLMLYLQRMLVL